MAPDAATKSPPWHLKDPEELPEDSDFFLCEACRHLDFKYLIFSAPLQQAVHEIPLDTYANVLRKQRCAFCRLIKAAIDNFFREGKILPTEHDGKPINLSMISTFSSSTNGSVPRDLLIWVKPNPFENGSTPCLSIHHVQEESWFDGTGNGRLIRPSEIDCTLAMLWVRTCRRGLLHHKDQSPEATTRKLPEGFRLIDVERKCIVPADSSVDYVTLSYMWGTGTPLKLETGNKAALEVDGALEDVKEFRDQLPQTIKDAMVLVSKLAERYLWVDALCIIQNDRIDQAAQISAMDVIYGESVLTIAATHGSGPETGLPGVRPDTRRFMQHSETVQGIRLANRPLSFRSGVEDSKWNTRAWTFQERILSKRTLFVGAQQVYFHCDHHLGHISEDLDTKLRVAAPVTHPQDGTGTDRIPDRWSINILTYAKLVEAFTTRNITMPDDYLNAFAGIEARMRPLFRSGFVFGLPQAELDYCLLWVPSVPYGSQWRIRNTKYLTRRQDKGKPVFPSWSWAGWVGAVELMWTERLSRVRWVDEQDRQWSSYDYRAPYTERDSTVLGGEGPSDWKKKWTAAHIDWGFRYFFHEDNPEQWFRNPTAPESERKPRIGPICHPLTDPQASLLRFYALTDNVPYVGSWTGTLPSDPGFDGHPLWQFNLADNEGHSIGFITVPVGVVPDMKPEKKYEIVVIARKGHSLKDGEIRERKAPEGENVDLAAVETIPKGAEARGKAEGIQKVASAEPPLEAYDGDEDVTGEKGWWPELPTDEDAKSWLCFDRRRYDAYKRYCLYEFLFVEWDEEAGVAYRLGRGEIHVDALKQEGPVWKLVTLG